MQEQALTTRSTTAVAPYKEQRGAIGVAFLIWLFGGGLGLAVLAFVLLKVC